MKRNVPTVKRDGTVMMNGAQIGHVAHWNGSWSCYLGRSTTELASGFRRQSDAVIALVRHTLNAAAPHAQQQKDTD